MQQFEVTEDHLKLVQRMYWQWDDHAYDGAPAVGLKRPYGNSDVMYDIAQILGWTVPRRRVCSMGSTPRSGTASTAAARSGEP